ncbi:hypothetical protein BK139_06875 [Paenibacillus sp. FSL R5-0490]|uniref:hypothetical protein n=1 Tax=Paenibacillus sp. FSL R5-0490 TaxID=1920424 RepID=UPI00096DECD0|nr:hypothetical protein [Paenibacillus sp. FSL R5-0490]OMF61555.1 hypothetical protein BK139_06875 [Paenibacillus sp. FSL R5-0490]
MLNKIRVKLDFFRETFSEDESNFDRKLLAWRQAETRYHRSQRLVDLGAPLLILNLEFVWLSVMLDHMRMVSLGIEPVFTQEQQEELAELRELEKGM